LIFITTLPTKNQLSFADHLFTEGDYFRAITEYKRYIFQSESAETILYAKKMILSSYKKAGRFEEALVFVKTFSSKSYQNTERGKLYLLMGNRTDARSIFKEILTDTARILTGWSYIEDTDWENSQKEFQRIPNTSNLFYTSSLLSQYAKNAEGEIITKNPFVSGFLSAIIPGAGRVYTGRTGDGIFSFLTVAIPAIVSYLYLRDDRKRAASIAIGFASVFYLGDIYGSVVSAHDFNRFHNRLYIEKIDRQVHIKEQFLE
jgi:TM2 domain-containing membrane protein YozV